MDSKTFDDLLKHYRSNFTMNETWSSLANKYQYGSIEAIRNSFKRERKRRGIPSKNKNNSKIPLLERNEKSYPFNVGIFDIETTPMKVYAFELWDQNISPDKIIEDSYILCWKAKILNKPEIYSGILDSSEAIDRNDERITKDIWNFLNGMQIVIGHNIKGFDLKVLNGKFLNYGLPPLRNFAVVDTYLVAKGNFYFPSNSLSYINRFLGIKQKMENDGFILWKKCMEGDEESLEKMAKYCEQDVFCSEDLYYRFRPFIKNHPNLGLYFESESSICRNCGSSNIIKEGFYYTSVGKYASVRCSDCGAIGRLKQNEIEKDVRKQLVM